MTLRLLPMGPDLARRIADGEEPDEIGPGPQDPVLREVAAAHLGLYEATGAAPPWIGYAAREEGRAGISGMCSFKGAPRDGRVEIA